ncbi:Vacuolar amino acid transporter 5, partial [Dictyocoela roeselum]
HEGTVISNTTEFRGPLSIIPPFVLIQKCFLVSAAYMSAIYNLLRTLVTRYNLSEHVLRVINAGVVSSCIPLILFNKIDKLKVSSFFGITAAVIMIFSSLFWLISGKFEGSLKLYGRPTLLSFGEIVFGFTCHQNIFTIQNELDLSIGTTIMTILLSGISAWALYLGFGIINAYGPAIDRTKTYIDIIPNTVLGLVVRISYILIIILSIPLQVNPCRNSLLELIGIDPMDQEHECERSAALLMIMISAFVLSIFSDNLNSLFKGIGSTVSSVLCFILPGFYYLILRNKRKNKLTMCMAVSSILFGLFVMGSYLITVFR